MAPHCANSRVPKVPSGQSPKDLRKDDVFTRMIVAGEIQVCKIFFVNNGHGGDANLRNPAFFLRQIQEFH